MASRNLAVGLAFVALSLATLRVALHPVAIFDEGFVLTNASRLLAGEIPHRDYWAAYPPGAAAILAVFFKFLGPSVAVARIVFIGWAALFLFSTFVLLRRFNDAAPAILGTLLIGLLLLTVEANHPLIAAMALAMASLAFQDRPRLGGALGGAVMLFRHDFAGYFVLAALIGWGVGRKSAAYLRMLLASTGVVLILVLAVAGPANFYDQAIRFPTLVLRQYRHLPVTPFYAVTETGWMLAWLAPLAAASVLTVAVLRRASDSRLSLVAQIASFGLLLVFQAHSRLDGVHALPARLFALTAVIALLILYLRWSYLKVAALIGVTLVSIASSAIFWNPVSERVRACERECFYNSEDQKAAAAFLQTHSEPDKPIFVGNTRHDIVLANDASLYFMAQRQPAIAWNEMNPGTVTTAAVQEQIIRDLDRQQVRFAVLVGVAPSIEPNRSAVSSGVFLLDRYLRDKYKPVAVFGPYAVLERE